VLTNAAQAHHSIKARKTWCACAALVTPYTDRWLNFKTKEKARRCYRATGL